MNGLVNRPFRMTVGLRPLAMPAWIMDLPDHEAQLRAKRSVLEHHTDVLARDPTSEAAVRELLSMSARHIATHLPARYSREGSHVRCLATGTLFDPVRTHEPLADLARIIPEDMVLMRRTPDATYELAAAALCFPTRWRLGEKTGHPMQTIHQPVPGYQASIGEATDKVMRSVTGARPLWRQNWSLVDSDALYQPVRKPLTASEAAVPIGRRLWLRAERQCLLRLPESGYVVFSIRIVQTRLHEACAIDGTAAALLTQLETMPAPLKRYKQMADVEGELRDYLATRADQQLE